MKSVSVFLALLGGLITLFGGLVGRVEISVLMVRTLLATAVSALVWFALFAILSKSLFADFFASLSSAPKTKNYQKSGILASTFRKRQKPQEIMPEENTEKAEDPFVFSGAENANDVELTDIMDDASEPAPPDFARSEDISKELRKADVRELAQIVRHSINEGQ